VSTRARFAFRFFARSLLTHVDECIELPILSTCRAYHRYYLHLSLSLFVPFVSIHFELVRFYLNACATEKIGKESFELSIIFFLIESAYIPHTHTHMYVNVDFFSSFFSKIGACRRIYRRETMVYSGAVASSEMSGEPLLSSICVYSSHTLLDFSIAVC
jgi:hypothetical protein